MSAEVTKEPSEDNAVNVLPSQKQLSVEAERISNILENCISHIEIAVTLVAALDKDDIPDVLEEEMSRAFEEHQMLCEILDTLDTPRDGDAGDMEEVKVAKLEREVKNSFRNLLRVVRGNPEAISSLKAELDIEVGGNEYLLIGVLKKFHKKFMKKLLTCPDKDPQNLDTQQTPFHILDKVEMESMEEAIAATATSIKQTEAQIYELENEIENLESSLTETFTPEVDVAALTEKQCKPYIKTAKKKQNSKQQEINQFNIQLNTLFVKNRKLESVNQEKTEMVKMETDDFLRKFEEEIEEIQGNLERSQLELEGDQEELRNLEKIYNVLEVEYNEVQARRQAAEEKRRQEMIELELKTKAAIMAQAWWRGYSVRKAMRSKSGKKKGKEKGKGKKGKGKKGK